ncbi:MAG: FG-GAP repeat protein [Phycisphaerales bacterium]
MSFKSSFTIPALAAISFCLIGGTTPVYADLGDQLFKLLAGDGAANDLFGRSVAISGTTAIVGAPEDADNGFLSGSAYLFDTTTGQQTFKLLPNDGAAQDVFGISVAISGATAIVGAHHDDDNGIDSGSAYLFDTTTGQQIAKLLPNDRAEEDLFGISVAISGSTAIVGAWFDDDNGFQSGSAYLFDISDPANPTQIAMLLPNDGAAEDVFGASVAITGSVAIVGATHDDDNGINSGSAYLFDTTTGQQIAKLLPDDGAAQDWFGRSVAISGATAIVGANGDDDNGPFSGSAYLFDTTTGQQIAKLLPNDGAADDYFGYSVAIGGAPGKETALVGARGDDDNGGNSGSAYLFDTTTGAQIAKLLPNDGAAGDIFGFSVAISGDTAIVGAFGDDDNGNGSGSAYLFDAAAPGKCPWDIDGSGSVGSADLLALLVSWGPCKDCPADFDGSGSVGAADLLALLANWGPCP